MVLRFFGGVRPDGARPAPCVTTEYFVPPSVALETDGKAAVKNGTPVVRGQLIADGTLPVYSTVCGIFRGIYAYGGSRYCIVTANGGSDTLALEPESRALTELTCDDISAWARTLGITDARSGLPLFSMLDSARGRVKRVIIDCTDSDPRSTLGSALTLLFAEDAVRGAKIILHAVRAVKAVFCLTASQKEAAEALINSVTDPALCPVTFIEEKYPVLDTTLVDAVAVKDLAKGENPTEKGILTVSLESAVALARGMSDGELPLDKHISVCGVSGERLLVIPCGTLTEDVMSHCGLNKPPVKNSLLCGEEMGEAIGADTRAMISAGEERVKTLDCIFCGKCVTVCPMRLMPYRIFTDKSYPDARYCVSCGACEHACPSGIPLLGMIKEATR